MNILNNATGLSAAFFVGLIAGVSTCMALVGGLVLSLSMRHAEQHPQATRIQKFRPHLFFNLGRVIGFFFLGGLIGFVGSFFKFSGNAFGILTILVSLIMIFLGLKLLDIFPFLKKINLTLPLSIARRLGITREQNEYSHKGAVISGVLTFFLPCGFTQAMQVAAVGTGSFWLGGLTMSLFALGTTLGLLGVGGLSSIFSGKRARAFSLIIGVVVIGLGIYNITNASRVFSSFSVSQLGQSQTSSMQAQEVRMTQDYSGYSPKVLTVKKGVPVKWIITSNNNYTCSASIVMPQYGINQFLQKGENVIEFTPTETGEIPFSCSMGMYRGKFIVN